MPLKLKTSAKMKELMAAYYRKLDWAATHEDERVAWCTSVGPVELLRAMGFHVYFPENHAAMLGAWRLAGEYIPTACSHGYSPEVCSYLTADVGAFIKGETPLGKLAAEVGELPRPDVLVYNTNQCRDVQDWMGFYARHFGVPLLGVASFRNLDAVQPHHLKAVDEQLRAMVPALERIAGTPFQMDNLRRTVALSGKACSLWRQVQRLGAHRPSPLSFFDGCFHTGPAVVLRGDEAAVDYYQALLDEIQTRVEGAVGSVPHERVRLYWEGMPIWGRMRDLAHLFERLGVGVVASTYCNAWTLDALDPDDPFASMAKAYTELFIGRSDRVKEDAVAQMAEEFGVDGILFHEAKTCPANSNSRYGMPLRLEERLGIPTLIIQADLNDLRCYGEEGIRLAIEAFIEGLTV